MNPTLPETVVLLEYEDEARAFLEECSQERESLDRTLIVALTPRAQIYLKERGIAYQNTLPYFDNQAHVRVLEKSEAMLQLLERNCTLPTVLRTELMFRIRVLISYLVWLAEILNAVHSRHSGVVILRAPSSRLPANDDRWFVTPAERYLGALAEVFAQQREIRFEEIVIQSQTTPIQPPDRPPSTRDLFRWASMKMLVGLLRLLLRRSSNALLTTSSYNLDQAAAAANRDVPDLTWLELLPGDVSSWTVLKRLVRVLLQANSRSQSALPLVPIPLAAFVARGSRVTESGQIEAAIADLAHEVTDDWCDTFSHCGVVLAPYIARKLLIGCRNSLRELAALRPAVRATLKAFDIKLVLTPHSVGISNIVGDTCRELGIPAIMITHGTHVPPRNRAEEIELYRMSLGTILAPSYQYTVAQTPWARRYTEYYGVDHRTLNTEPILFSRVSPADRESMRREILNGTDDINVIVYAVTHKPTYSPRFYVYETEDEVHAAMADLVRAVNEIDETHLVFKLHPGYPYSETELRSLLPECDKLTVLHREPFFRVLSAADMLVSFSSTTIEEAIYNRVPVLLYDKWHRYCHVEAYNCDLHGPLEPAAVYYTGRAHRLSITLSHILDSAATARSDDSLYTRHSFAAGEYQPFSRHVKRIFRIE